MNPCIKPRRTQAERRAETEQKILVAALELVARKGSEGFTLADVGALANCSRGLPAHYFGNKQGLLDALVVYLLENYNREFAGTRKPQPGIDSLRNAVETYFHINQFSSTESKSIIVLLSEAILENSKIKPQLLDYNQRAIRHLENHIKIGKQKGEIKADIDTKAAAVFILGAMRGSMNQKFLDPEIDTEQIKLTCMNFIEKVLAI